MMAMAASRLFVGHGHVMGHVIARADVGSWLIRSEGRGEAAEERIHRGRHEMHHVNNDVIWLVRECHVHGIFIPCHKYKCT